MGTVDLFHSRRINFSKCDFWIRDERDSSGSPQQWVLYNKKSGSFYARPISPKNIQMDVISGTWAFDSNHVTLVTDDDIHEISRGSLVRYDDELWIVENVQKTKHLKESEFSKHPDYFYTVSIRRG